MSKRVNKKYKDRLFRFIFKEKKELLALYNALNGTHYTDPDRLEITTLEDVVYEYEERRFFSVWCDA